VKRFRVERLGRTGSIHRHLACGSHGSEIHAPTRRIELRAYERDMVASYKRKRLAGRHPERCARDGDPCSSALASAEEPERRGWRGREHARSAEIGLEAPAILQLDGVRGGRVERSLHVEPRVRSEHDASRIHQEEIRVCAERAIDVGFNAAGHAGEDVVDSPAALEVRALRAGSRFVAEAEALEAVEEVRTALLAHPRRDHVIRAARLDGNAWAERAVADDAALCRTSRRRQQHRSDQDRQESQPARGTEHHANDLDSALYAPRASAGLFLRSGATPSHFPVRPEPQVVAERLDLRVHSSQRIHGCCGPRGLIVAELCEIPQASRGAWWTL
jgi:hypothetical protein